ncbi:Chain_A [Hexamita inflata]|uniref:Leucine Rich Repeat Protein n=1 Tax=Hexamita inflata TaxID=28002 RepID=A0AA86TK44_9EUKA|nr:Chain A [Hexamita inflata]
MSNIKVNTLLQLTGYEQLGELTKVFQYNVNKLKLFECYNISTPNASICTRTGNIFNLNAIPKSITELLIEKCELDNIEGFQFMDQLQILVLANNKLQQIDQLKNLTNLTFLDLQRNQIKDILMLQSLTSLVHLNLSQNRITDISVLQFLPQIITLDISNNGLSDIQPTVVAKPTLISKNTNYFKTIFCINFNYILTQCLVASPFYFITSSNLLGIESIK